MDNSSIYIRENGNLRLVSGIVLAQQKPMSSCRRTNPFVLREEHFIFTYNAEGSLRYTSKSLFDITLSFVADNIQHVDSLVDFPEQIGERLFAAAEAKRMFLKPDVSQRAFQVFSDAYGEIVLKSLCLRNRFPLLHERLDEIKTFHSLKRLDLYGCRLGDHHEIFQHLTSSSLSSHLIQLFIGGNRLSDVGLQRLTAPVRMRRRGLDCLQFLDISCLSLLSTCSSSNADNPISERVFRYLKCLPKLEKLDLSGTKLKVGTELKSKIYDMFGLLYSEEPLDVFDHSRCITEGWAKQVVSQWETNASHMPKQKKMEESRISALRFFGRQKFVQDTLNEVPLLCERKEAKEEKMHFYKPSTNKHLEEKLTHSFDHTINNIKKRPNQSERNDSSSEIPHTKLFYSALTAEDTDLLNYY